MVRLNFLCAASLATMLSASTIVEAAPSVSQADQLTFSPSYALADQPVFRWIHSTLTNAFSSGVNTLSDQVIASDPIYSSLEVPDYSDKTIWEVIQTNEHLSDLKRILRYSGPRTKELLDDKEKKLTFLAPVNWHHRRHEKNDDDVENAEMAPSSSVDMVHGNMIEAHIRALEDERSNVFDDDKDKERKRKMLAYIIDATIEYHIIDGEKPLTAWNVAQNSSVATRLSIGHGRAREIFGNLLDGNAFRLRVGKSLLPRPSAYFNFYSRLVYPDVNVGGSLVHAISAPLLIPPSLAQTIYFSQPYLAGTSTALLKTHLSPWFRYPFNHSALHDHDGKEAFTLLHPLAAHPPAASSDEDMLALTGETNRADHGHGHNHSEYQVRGQSSVTLFTPSNVAWTRLPPVFRLFLMSPWGTGLLRKIIALHTLPHTVFYADFVHVAQHHGDHDKSARHETVSASDLVASPEWLWGPTSESPAFPTGEANVSRYTFNTALPKLHFNHSSSSESDVTTSAKKKFETVDVNVYRYHILPGGRGPLQTRVSIQGVPVAFQDIAVLNGATHVLNAFIKPKGHPHKGIWAHVAEQAEQLGFGSVDWQTESF